jgi:hypothetical protein
MSMTCAPVFKAFKAKPSVYQAFSAKPSSYEAIEAKYMVDTSSATKVTASGDKGDCCDYPLPSRKLYYNNHATLHKMDTSSEEKDEIDSDCEGGCEDPLPPPKPNYDRHAAMLMLQGSLTSSFLSIDPREGTKDSLKSECARRIIPNPNGGRSQHNRRIGKALAHADAISCNKSAKINQSAEFDLLLLEVCSPSK